MKLVKDLPSENERVCTRGDSRAPISTGLPLFDWLRKPSACFDPGPKGAAPRVPGLRNFQTKGSAHHEPHPQVETLEISDNDLDNVSGGLIGGVLGNVTATADSIAPVTGIVGSVTGLVESTTGVNTGAVTGLATGLTAGL